MDDLRRAYDELKARFERRTAELERANASLADANESLAHANESLAHANQSLGQANVALLESEQRFRVALVDTPVVVFNQDRDLRYTWIYNPQNYAALPVVGKTDVELYSPADAERLTILKRRVMAEGVLSRETVSLTMGGRTLFYDMTLDPLRDAAGNVIGLTCAATDITERKQIEDELHRRLTEIEGIQRIARGLLKKVDLDEVLEIVCSEAMRLTEAQGSAVLLLDDDGWLRLTHHAGAPIYTPERLPVNGTFVGQAVQTGEHVWMRRVDGAPGDPPDSWPAGLSSMLAVPLKLEPHPIGVLHILNKPGEMTQEDIRIIHLFADQAAIIIEHARLQRQAEQLAVVEERQRLARELHDSVTQALYSMALYADAARRALAAGQHAALERNLGEVRSMAREAMYDMRLLVFELRPFRLEKDGVVAALRARVAAVEGRAGLQAEVLADGERRLPIVIEEEIYRIAQEGLNNAVKHAEAKAVQIRLIYEAQAVTLEIEDNGAGFDQEAAENSGGVGLRGIYERAQRLGGNVTIASAPGRGTRLRVALPTGERAERQSK